MISTPTNKKQLIYFLLKRWQNIIGFAALEKVFLASSQYAKANNQPLPVMPLPIVSLPCRQIEIIKRHIIEILPEAHFIDYNYEAQAPLNPNDFAEVYVADHQQCIEKVCAVMERLQIT